MKGMKRAIAVLFSLLLFITVPVHASGFEVTCAMNVSSDIVMPGDTVTITFSLEGYEERTDLIRGLQIDLQNVDPDIFVPEEYVSLIEDTDTLSNKGSFNTSQKFCRLFFAKT